MIDDLKGFAHRIQFKINILRKFHPSVLGLRISLDFLASKGRGRAIAS